MVINHLCLQKFIHWLFIHGFGICFPVETPVTPQSLHFVPLHWDGLICKPFGLAAGVDTYTI